MSLLLLSTGWIAPVIETHFHFCTFIAHRLNVLQMIRASLGHDDGANDGAPRCRNANCNLLSGGTSIPSRRCLHHTLYAHDNDQISLSTFYQHDHSSSVDGWRSQHVIISVLSSSLHVYHQRRRSWSTAWASTPSAELYS